MKGAWELGLKLSTSVNIAAREFSRDEKDFTQKTIQHSEEMYRVITQQWELQGIWTRPLLLNGKQVMACLDGIKGKVVLLLMF